MENKLLLAVDGPNLMHRGYFTKNELETSYGRKVNGVYNFFNILFKTMSKYNPTDMVVAWDAGTWRKDLLEDYKGQRPDKDDGYRKQKYIVKAGLISFRLPNIMIDNYEADDIIAHIVHKFDGDVVIMSDDHDFNQLLEDSRHRVVYQLSSKSGELREKDVTEKYGVEPERLPFLWALSGNTSDNIKGIPKVGLKRAKKLLDEHESFDEIFKDEKYEKYHGEVFKYLDIIRLGIMDIPVHELLDTALVEFYDYDFNEKLLFTYLDDLEFYDFRKRIAERSLV